MRVTRAADLRRWLRVSLLLACGFLLACHHKPTERSIESERRAVLLPQDLQKEQREAYEKTRLTTDTGDLIPSESKVAGLILPRGLSAALQPEHEWYFDGPLALPKLEKYFRERLQVTSEKRPNNATLELSGSIVQGDPLANPVTVSLFPQPGRLGRSTVHIRELVPRPPLGTPEQVRAQIAERQRYAH